MAIRRIVYTIIKSRFIKSSYTDGNVLCYSQLLFVKYFGKFVVLIYGLLDLLEKDL